MVGKVLETPSSAFEVADATVVGMVAGRQEEELLSMNLGLGTNLVLLLSESDVELRAQEALESESR